VVLLIVVIVFWSNGRLAGAYRRPTRVTPTGPFLEAFAVYMAAMVGLGALARFVLRERLVATWFVLVVLPFVFLWPLLRGIPRGELGSGLGWHRGRGFFREVGAGIVGYLAGLPVLAAGGAINARPPEVLRLRHVHPIVNELGGDGWKIFRLFLLAAVWAPIVEETMFRGATLPPLRGRLSLARGGGGRGGALCRDPPAGLGGVPCSAPSPSASPPSASGAARFIAPAVAHAINNGAVTLLLVLLLR